MLTLGGTPLQNTLLMEKSTQSRPSQMPHSQLIPPTHTQAPIRNAYPYTCRTHNYTITPPMHPAYS